MEQIRTTPGSLDKQEKDALEDETRRKILDLIGLDLMRIWELEDELELKTKELKDHLAMLEEARLVEQDEECYRLTPRCVAYLNECQGYEWRR
jgi:predicted transcriptional regulator